MYNRRLARHRAEILNFESTGAEIREGYRLGVIVRDWSRNVLSKDHTKVIGFFNKIQVTCVGAHVDEFVINESDHALIYIYVIGSREQLSAISILMED